MPALPSAQINIETIEMLRRSDVELRERDRRGRARDGLLLHRRDVVIDLLERRVLAT